MSFILNVEFYFIVYFDNKSTCTHPGNTVNVNNPNYISNIFTLVYLNLVQLLQNKQSCFAFYNSVLAHIPNTHTCHNAIMK